jgi:hypothetical protein
VPIDAEDDAAIRRVLALGWTDWAPAEGGRDDVQWTIDTGHPEHFGDKKRLLKGTSASGARG